jgi:hypothetical protein
MERIADHRKAAQFNQNPPVSGRLTVFLPVMKTDGSKFGGIYGLIRFD